MSGTNPVGTFQPTSYTSQTGTAYPLAIDGDWAVASRLVDDFAPHAQSTPNMTVALDAGHVFNGAALTEVAAQTTAAFTAPAGNPRIDRVVIDRVTGAVSVITGTPASSPSPPAITAGKNPVAQVLLQTTSTAISNAMITDERDLGALGTPASSLNVVSGNQSIGVGQNGQTFLATAGLSATIAQTTTLHAFWGLFFFAYGGAITVSPNSGDSINGGTAGASAVIPAGCTGALSTDANGHLYLEIAPAVLGSGSIASAATTDIGSVANPVVQITGTTAITSLGSSIQPGQSKILYFAASLTLTNNSNIILEGNASITTAAGDMALAFCTAAGVCRVIYAPLASSSGVPSGTIMPFAGLGNGFGSNVPTGWLLANGQSVSRTTYATLFGIICPGTTATMTIASPCVVTINSHGLVAGDAVTFETTGALPTGLTARTTYYVVSPATNTFELSATQGGSAINTSGSQSGTHTCFRMPYGGLTSTNFNLPDLRGRAPFGQDNMGATTAAGRITSSGSGIYGQAPGSNGGAETVTETSSTLVAHSHGAQSQVSGNGASYSPCAANFSVAGNTSSTGSSNPALNMPGALIVNYIIKT